MIFLGFPINWAIQLMLFENQHMIPIPVSFYFLSEYTYEIKQY